MGIVRPAPRALVFAAITANDPALFGAAEKALIERHGSLLEQWGPFRLDTFTRYYEREMGKPLDKIFMLFRRARSTEAIHRLKLESNALEDRWRENGNRCVNIDPGFLTLFNFCLLTTKGFSHRIYLAAGIYAEVTLRVFRGKLTPLEWTYADYQSPAALDFLERGRRHLKCALAETTPETSRETTRKTAQDSQTQKHE
jgi:hypothetical protein